MNFRVRLFYEASPDLGTLLGFLSARRYQFQPRVLKPDKIAEIVFQEGLEPSHLLRGAFQIKLSLWVDVIPTAFELLLVEKEQTDEELTSRNCRW